jgi:glycine/D-amino acid oxidase-like deaminating enzyme
MNRSVAIVGGGFAGAYCARHLERWLDRDGSWFSSAKRTS